MSSVIKFMKVRPDAVLPIIATEGSAGFDLAWCPSEEGKRGLINGNSIALDSSGTSYEPHHTFETGIAAAIPKGFVGLVFSRSGHGFHANVRLANCVGVIDSDYRGEIRAKMTIDSGFHRFQIGERVAQLVVVPYLSVAEEVTAFEMTERGEKGYGSTGK